MVSDTEIVKALALIKKACDERKHDCTNCSMSNMKNECLVYEYPYLWNVHEPETIVKIMSE